jgi:hypothetical protein
MASRKNFGKPFRLIGALAVGLALGCAATVGVVKYGADGAENISTIESLNHDARMEECINRTIKIANPKSVNIGLFERAWRICGNQIFNGLYLEDFIVRRDKLLQQRLDDRVNLWLVVVITMSGVILAAVQLVMSFQLASKGTAEFGKDNELALESGRISLRTSITGAIILALSFAFFMVYVIWIYTVYELPKDKPGNLEPPNEYREDGAAADRPQDPATQTRRARQVSKDRSRPYSDVSDGTSTPD